MLMIVRKIQTSERAVELLGGCVVSPRRIIFSLKGAEKTGLDRRPGNNRLPPMGAPDHTLELRNPKGLLVPILGILSLRTEAEIVPRVIQTIPVDVIDKDTLRCAEDQPVNEHFMFSTPQRRVRGPVLSHKNIDVEAPDKRNIGLVNLHDAAIAKMDASNTHGATE